VHVPRVHLTAGEQYMKLFVESGSIDVKSLEASRSS